MSEECAATSYGGRSKQSKVKGANSLPRRAGYVEGKEVRDIVLDIDAARTLVRDNLVPRNRYLNKLVSVQCVHGDNVSHPLSQGGGDCRRQELLLWQLPW